MTTVSRTTTQGKDQEVLNGIHKELQSMQTMHLGSETYTPQTLADFIQSRIDLANAVLTTCAAWENTVLAYEAINKKAIVVLGDLRHLVMAAFGRDTPKRASFGFRPRRCPPSRPSSGRRPRARHSRRARRDARWAR